MELVDREQLGDIQYLKNRYEWLLDLSDDELSQKVIDTNDVQNALIELLRFVDEVSNLPKLHLGCDGKPVESSIETSNKWLDMN